MMKANVSIDKGIVTVKFIGHLDALSAAEADKIINEVLDGGHRRLVFDMADLDYVNSTGLRVILSAVKRLMADGGKVALAAMNPSVKEIFDVSGLTSLFLITESVDQAVDKLH